LLSALTGLRLLLAWLLLTGLLPWLLIALGRVGFGSEPYKFSLRCVGWSQDDNPPLDVAFLKKANLLRLYLPA
jgi:hypothetical protein